VPVPAVALPAVAELPDWLAAPPLLTPPLDFPPVVLGEVPPLEFVPELPALGAAPVSEPALAPQASTQSTRFRSSSCSSELHAANAKHPSASEAREDTLLKVCSPDKRSSNIHPKVAKCDSYFHTEGWVGVGVT
jgi:hypothetical protein